MSEQQEQQRPRPRGSFGPRGHGTAVATGFALGAISMAGVALALCGPAAGGPFGAYVALLAAFHQLEYICVAAYRADTLSFDCASAAATARTHLRRAWPLLLALTRAAAAVAQRSSSTTAQRTPSQPSRAGSSTQSSCGFARRGLAGALRCIHVNPGVAQQGCSCSVRPPLSSAAATRAHARAFTGVPSQLPDWP